jgi:hypothetical protein
MRPVGAQTLDQGILVGWPAILIWHPALAPGFLLISEISGVLLFGVDENLPNSIVAHIVMCD